MTDNRVICSENGLLTLAVLKRLEWSQSILGSPFCPLCGNSRHDGHWPTCDLAAALAQRQELAETWRPIAEATEDGLVDIWTVGWGSEPHRLTDCYYDRICGEWRTSRPQGRLICVPERYVTHWMPLPLPPLPATTETRDE